MDSIQAHVARHFLNGPFNTGQAEVDLMERYPEFVDSSFYRSNYHLLRKQPTPENHKDYYKLAVTLWNLTKLKEAEKMFLTMIASPVFDDNSNVYKNSACTYLARIYIEQEKYKKGIHYTDLAEKKYPMFYKTYPDTIVDGSRYRYYYARCYEALKMNNEMLDLLLPYCFDNNYGMLIRAIKEMYTPEQIQAYLTEAENSITCQTDSFLSHTIVTTYKDQKPIKRYHQLLFWHRNHPVIRTDFSFTTP